MARPKPVVLIILDGFGIAPSSRGNAIALAKTPNLDRYVRTYHTYLLQAAGEAVGALWGEMGNSEMGHLNIGAGRIVYQDIQRINTAISTGTFFTNEALLSVIEAVKKRKGTLHIMGLLSSGHVHASFEHYTAMVEMALRHGIRSMACHVWLDGRDAPYASGIDSVKLLQARLERCQGACIATMAGRWWAMDRDNHWERTAKVYHAMVHGVSDHTAVDPVSAIESSYQQHIFDEEFPPTVMVKKGKPKARIKDGDGIVVINFRADRARQITQCLAADSFDRFDRGTHPKNLSLVSMTRYDARLSVPVAFPPVEIRNCLAEVISQLGLRQLHIAETEKYAHVTYFLNGGREAPFPGEDNILIPSPPVSNYDQHPSMSAPAIKDKVLEAITARTYDVICINFANADMVAHTGNLAATVQAIETLDTVLGQIVDVSVQDGGAVVITADHGNAEGLLKVSGEIDKEHSAEPVPCIIAGKGYEHAGLAGLSDLATLKPAGILADIAPTILTILDLPQPVEMTGRSLV